MDVSNSHECDAASFIDKQELSTSSDSAKVLPDSPVLHLNVLTCVPFNDAPATAKPENSAEVESSACISIDETLENTFTPEPLGSLSAALESKDTCPCSAAAPSLSEISEILESHPLESSTNESSLPSSDTIVPGSSPKPSVRLNGVCVTGHKKCEYGNGCTVQPSFNYPGEMGGMFCGCHRLEGMVNVVNKMCEFPGCHKRPSLNYPGVRPAIRCGEHKLPGMTNSFRKLDTSILSGELKDKAEELKKRPKKRGDMIKVQRHFIKEKIFSEVINEELSREGQSETHTATSPNSNAQTTPKSTAAITLTSKTDPIVARSFPAPPSTPNVTNNSNLTNYAYGAPFQTSNLALQTASVPLQKTYSGANHLFSSEFTAAYAANMNLYNGGFQGMKDLGFGASGFLPGYFPGMQSLHQFQLDQFHPYHAFNTGFQPHFQDGRPSLYSNAIPPVSQCMPPPNVSKEGGEDVDLSVFASIASSMPHGSTSSFAKRQKLEDGKGKIAELLSRTTEEKSGGAFANVAGRSFRPIVGRATPMTFPKC
jgi:hypothetical protein